MINYYLRKDLGKKDKGVAKKLDGIMRHADSLEKKEVLGEIVQAIAEVREDLRKKKEYDMSDYIREKLNEMGIILEDKQAGVRWRMA